jgi:hypothetical protein
MGGWHTKALGKDLGSLLGVGAVRDVLLWSAVFGRRRLDERTQNTPAQVVTP